MTEIKISILDSKTNMFLTLFVLGLYYEVLNEYYPRGREFWYISVDYRSGMKATAELPSRAEKAEPDIGRV